MLNGGFVSDAMHKCINFRLLNGSENEKHKVILNWFDENKIICYHGVSGLKFRCEERPR
jgi:hypothetical protein